MNLLQENSHLNSDCNLVDCSVMEPMISEAQLPLCVRAMGTRYNSAYTHSCLVFFPPTESDTDGGGGILPQSEVSGFVDSPWELEEAAATARTAVQPKNLDSGAPAGRG